MRMAERIDPYWSSLSEPTKADWRATTATDAPVKPARRRLASMSRNETIDHILESPLRAEYISVLSMIASYGIVTREQIAFAALRGDWARHPRVDLLSHAGLIQSCKMPTGAPAVFRILPGRPLGRLVRALTRDERASIWGPTNPQRAGTLAVRHNVLAAEVALRASEILIPRPSVGGELATIHRHLFGPTAQSPGNRAASDGLIVRPDGRPVLIELTAASGRGLADKIGRVADLLCSEGPARDGMVVFVEAGRPSKSRTLYGTLRNRFDDVLAARPHLVESGVCQHLAIARWQDWFPASHQISSKFRRLEVEAPVASGRWESACLWVDSASEPSAGVAA